MRTEYAAPTGLKFVLVLFYKYVAPTALWQGGQSSDRR